MGHTAGSLPAITGRQLMRLLLLDGWELVRRAPHGRFYAKTLPDGTRIHATVPDKTRPLKPGTLSAILGLQQTGLGRAGLAALIAQHGRK